VGKRGFKMVFSMCLSAFNNRGYKDIEVFCLGVSLAAIHLFVIKKAYEQTKASGSQKE